MASEKQHPQFESALRAIDEGGEEDLKRLLGQFPDLAQARCQSGQGCYQGYFYQATLLHHVAGNPFRGEFPENIIAMAKVLVAAGADVNADCGGGPSQPGSKGVTVLDLVCSSAMAYKVGLSGPLIDLLLGAGALLNRHDRGETMWTALFHTVENRGQREVARLLYERGHPVDMCFAAGLGLMHQVRDYIYLDGQLKEGADRYYQHHRGGRASQQEVMADALLFACINGEAKMAKFLIEQGVPVDSLRPWGGEEITGLHAAAWAGWPEVARTLMQKGADATLRDPNHHSTPIGWADYSGNKQVFDLLTADPNNLDLMDALEFGQTERFKALFGDGDPDMAVGRGKRGVLLRMAAYRGNKILAAFLVAQGADISLASSDGTTALGWAAKQNQQEMVDYLTGLGAKNHNLHDQE